MELPDLPIDDTIYRYRHMTIAIDGIVNDLYRD